MSTSPAQGHQHDPTEEELRASYEEQLSRVTSAEMALQAAVSLVAVGGRRLGLVPGSQSPRDLEQVRDAIDAVRGLMPILERRLAPEISPLRDALSQLQMAYAREATSAATGAEEVDRQGSEGAGRGGEPVEPGQRPTDAGDGDRDDAHEGAHEGDHEEASAGGKQASPDGSSESPRKPGPGPAEASGRLWVPGR
jgi:hypothetical protein